MKGLKLCSGLLLASLITFGAFFAGSSDVDALEYQVTKIPLLIPSSSSTFPPAVSLDPPSFVVEVSSDYFPDDFIYGMSSLSQYVLSLSGSSEGCDATAFRHFPIVNAGSVSNKLVYSFPGYNPSDNWTTRVPWTFDPCGSSFPPTIRPSSIAPLTGNLQVRHKLQSLPPYRYSYDGMFVRDSRHSDGLNYDTKFDLIYNLFSTYDNAPDRIYSVQIPLGSPDFVIPSDTPLSVEGEFVFDFEDPSVDVLSSSTTLSLGIYIRQSSGGGSYTYSVPCSYNLSRDDPDDPMSVWGLKYSCDSYVGDSNSNIYTPSTDIVIPYLIIDFDYLSSNINRFHNFIFDSMVTITDNDSTPADSAWSSTPITGANPSSAPGSAYNSSVPNYDSSLTGMFNFSFVNPFQGVFDLFASSSCVEIPTLASMLHSNETTVCPWFPNQVRSIVTPVLGLSSMMLLFGFTVRWLGARSGNFIEDSGGIDSGGYHFENKFRRKK